MNALPSSFLDYVNHGREERNLEYKEILDLQAGEHKAKLAKAVMAFSNIRDGGVFVLGVRKDGTPVGVPHEQAGQFTHDAIAPIVAEYAAPYVELGVTVGHDGASEPKCYVIIEVNEFAEIPVLCKKDYAAVIRQGAAYTRSRRTHESTEIRSEAEMRELLDMAVEKGIRSFYRRLEASGLQVSPGVNDVSLFEEQLGGL